MNPERKPTDRSVFERLSRRRLPHPPSAPPGPEGVATHDEPEDDNFYFETSIASPAVQLSVWELLNDEEEPRDGPAGDDPLDESVLAPGHTATATFWASDDGQELLLTFDDGPSATRLAGWLAETFPNLYGPEGRGLAGKTNEDVAALARQVARALALSLEAQVLALALACYATREFLGGQAAGSFGFRVSPLGAAPCVCNTGALGAPFRAANGSALTVLQLLLALDGQAERGVPLAGNPALRQQAHDLLDLINRFGDVRG